MKCRPSSINGFSLVEVTMALGIAAFALLAIFGLLPVGLNNNLASIRQTAATDLATAIIADMRQTPTAAAANAGLSSKSAKYGVDVTAPDTTIYLDESGTLQASASAARYKAVISLTQPDSGSRSATYGSVTISWPAAAATPLGSVSAFVGLDRN